MTAKRVVIHTGMTRELLARCWRNEMDAANPSTAQRLEACPRTIESFPSPELEETMLDGALPSAFLV